MLQAYKAGLQAQWMFPNWFDSTWWRNSAHCTAEQMLQAIDGAIYTGYCDFSNFISQFTKVGNYDRKDYLAAVYI